MSVLAPQGTWNILNWILYWRQKAVLHTVNSTLRSLEVSRDCIPSHGALSYCLNFLIFKSGTVLLILVPSISKETFSFFCNLTMCSMSGTQKYQMKQITLWIHDKWPHQETILCFSTFWKPSLKHWQTLWRGAKVLSVSQGCHEIQVWQYTQKHFYIYKLLHRDTYCY